MLQNNRAGKHRTGDRGAGTGRERVGRSSMIGRALVGLEKADVTRHQQREWKLAACCAPVSRESGREVRNFP
eukprot:1295222-Prymnesium_polylepis.1